MIRKKLIKESLFDSTEYIDGENIEIGDIIRIIDTTDENAFEYEDNIVKVDDISHRNGETYIMLGVSGAGESSIDEPHIKFIKVK
jgi:hypothetical protein